MAQSSLESDFLPDSDRLSRRQWLLRSAGCMVAGSVGLGAAQAQDDPTGGDPLGSMQWPLLRRKFLGNEPLIFDSAIQVLGPPFAEDGMNVPLQIDARALVAKGHVIDRMVVVADRNPVQHVLTFMPHRVRPVLAFRLRMEQSSPVRVLVRTQAGQWHVGQTWVDAAGGGCTVPGATRADGSWPQTLNQVQARWFALVGTAAGGSRLRLRIMHPMDTGLVAGVPAFYIDALELRDTADQLWLRLEPHEPLSENPLLTFELDQRPLKLFLQGHDNNGNRIAHEVQP